MIVFCPSCGHSSRKKWGFPYKSVQKSCDKWGPNRREEMTNRKNQTVAQRLKIERRFTDLYLFKLLETSTLFLEINIYFSP